jgi:hypothetical protein
MPMFTLNDPSRRAASRRLVEAYSWFEQSQAIKLFDHKKPVPDRYLESRMLFESL